ncbi:hypothetical protein ACRQ5D_27100 [Mucilaginibacter sp. P25]|uniref:hypothetical protein n=1 Tax=unclassified Mucilaginibacter TaxID=2617802 RepID=UPI003D677C0F
MKKSVIYILAAAASLCLPACKKFLNVQPIDKLTGNNFYQSKDDVVANIYDMSRTFFGKINETHFIGATGEYRSGEVLSEPQADNGPARAYVEVLGRNDLLGLINGNPPWNFYNFYRITDWTGYYQVIQSANILISKLEAGVPGVSDSEKSSLRAKRLLYAGLHTSLW